MRVASTVFNGASNVSQAGGIACLKVTDANSDNRHPFIQEQATRTRTAAAILVMTRTGDVSLSCSRRG